MFLLQLMFRLGLLSIRILIIKNDEITASKAGREIKTFKFRKKRFLYVGKFKIKSFRNKTKNRNRQITTKLSF